MPHTPQFLRMALLPLLLALPTLCLQDSRPGVSADYEKALAWLKEGRPAEALPLLEAARERQPSDPDVLYNLAGCYFALNRSEDGARIAEELARPAFDRFLLLSGLYRIEMVVNVVHKAAPAATIAFNTRPEDTAEAAARQLNPG